MKNKQPLLWLLFFLIVAHGYIALETIPEFHVLDRDELSQKLDEVKMQSMSADELRRILFLAHGCDANGVSLGMYTLIIDAAMFVIVSILMAQCFMAEIRARRESRTPNGVT
jgi:hypothetical protein